MMRRRLVGWVDRVRTDVHAVAAVHLADRVVQICTAVGLGRRTPHARL